MFVRRQPIHTFIVLCVFLLSVGWARTEGAGSVGGSVAGSMAGSMAGGAVAASAGIAETGAADAGALGPDSEHLPVAGLLKETRLSITYPSIDDVYMYFGDAEWPGGIELPGAHDVNRALREQALRLLEELAEFGHVEGGYEVSRADLHLISVTMHYAGYDERMAHPAHLRASVTANPITGRVYELADLFIDDTYVDRLSEAVASLLHKDELYTFEPFETILPDQDFYLTDGGLVLYFQVYELAPYAAGFPEFFIPYRDIVDIVRADVL